MRKRVKTLSLLMVPLWLDKKKKATPVPTETSVFFTAYQKGI